MLAHPVIDEFGPESPLNGVFCYIQEYHAEEGYSVIIRRDGHGGLTIRIGDWAGNDLSPGDPLWSKILDGTESGVNFYTIAGIMAVSKVYQAQFFVSMPDKVLVDVRMSLNKWLGPGMIEGLFGKMCRTAKTLLITNLTPDIVAQLDNKSGIFNGNLLLRPSSFRCNEDLRPTYAKSVR